MGKSTIPAHVNLDDKKNKISREKGNQVITRTSVALEILLLMRANLSGFNANGVVAFSGRRRRSPASTVGSISEDAYRFMI
jgi:hypothetical protein